MHLKEKKKKIRKLNTAFQATGLIFTFNNANLQLKLMNKEMLTEILVMKLKDKKNNKKNLTRKNLCLL